MEKQDAINSLVNAVAKQGRHKALANTMREVVPSIAQQDYIIIDWEGKDSTNAEKKAEVDAQLKNIYLANPLALFSVVFKRYGSDEVTSRIVSFLDDGDTTVTYGLAVTDVILELLFSISE